MTTMTTTTYTAEAKELLGEFVQRAGRTFLVVRASDEFVDPITIKITPAHVAEFYTTQANNLSSGIRTLAGLHGTGGRSASWRTWPWTGSRT